MNTKVRHPDQNRSSKTTVHAEHPYERRHFTESCSEHSQRLERLGDLDDLVIERGGMNYQLKNPERTVIGYCPECLASRRYRSRELSDTSDRELVKKYIRENYGTGRVGGKFRDLFEPVSASVGGGISHCPYCGDELDLVNQNTGRCICPEHGEMNLNIKQIDI